MSYFIFGIIALVLVIGFAPVILIFLSWKNKKVSNSLWRSIVGSAIFIGIMIGIIFLTRSTGPELIRIPYMIMGIALIGFMLAIVYRSMYLILKIFNKQDHMISLPAWWSFIILWIGVTAWGIYNFHRPLDGIELTFESPAVSTPVTFAFFADTQLGSTSPNHFDKVIDRINSLNPEFILFGGDLIDDDYYDLEDFRIFDELQVPLYYITGNHEYYHFYPRLQEIFTSYDQVSIVDDERLSVAEGVELIGIDYRNKSNKNEYFNQIEALPASDEAFSIFMFHEPTWVEETAQLGGYDLQLYGHTHRGQLYPGPWIIHAIYGAYGYGLTLIDGLQTRVYTTSGAGLFGPNIRLGTRNEIVMITVNPEQETTP